MNQINQIEISIVLPIFNEKKIIPELIQRTIKSVEKNTMNYEIILVDDGSTDQSRELIKDLCKKSFKPSNWIPLDE